jgi:type II secretory pathway pseudopilin PulG
MGATAPSLIARRRRPEAAVSDESGFVLILVLPVALMLIMTALSLVSRSNSAALSSAREARAQAARMAAEYGFLEMMGRVNSEYDPSITFEGKEIPGSLSTNYIIRDFNPPSPATPCDATTNAGDDVNVTIKGTLKVGFETYTQTISRSLRVCAPIGNPNQLRVRSYS